MGNTFVISGLRQKRARIAGEIAQAREVIARRTEELAAVDTVLRLFAPDCDPDMIPPIKPASHGLFRRMPADFARLPQCGRNATLTGKA